MQFFTKLGLMAHFNQADGRALLSYEKMDGFFTSLSTAEVLPVLLNARYLINRYENSFATAQQFDDFSSSFCWYIFPVDSSISLKYCSYCSFVKKCARWELIICNSVSLIFFVRRSVFPWSFKVWIFVDGRIKNFGKHVT